MKDFEAQLNALNDGEELIYAIARASIASASPEGKDKAKIVNRYITAGKVTAVQRRISTDIAGINTFEYVAVGRVES